MTLEVMLLCLEYRSTSSSVLSSSSWSVSSMTGVTLWQRAKAKTHSTNSSLETYYMNMYYMRYAVDMYLWIL